MLSLLRRRSYAFQVVTYESNGTWAALAIDVEIVGFGDTRDEAHADLRAGLQGFVEQLGGAWTVPVNRRRRSRTELRRLGRLTTVEIPNPQAANGCALWPSWLFRSPKAEP